MPAEELPEMTFLSFAPTPPITLFDEPRISTPWKLGTGWVPAAFVPM